MDDDICYFNGIYLLYEIRLMPNVTAPIVVMMTNAERKNQKRAYIHGTREIIFKPIDPAVLLCVIKRLLVNYYVLEKEPA